MNTITSFANFDHNATQNLEHPQTNSLPDSTLATPITSNTIGHRCALIIEDNKLVQLMHRKLLMAMGYSVDIAQDARTALSMMHKTYQLILLDIILPDRNGIEMATEIRIHQQASHELKIIGITAYATERIKYKCLGAGINTVLSKPLNPQRLEDAISTKSNDSSALDITDDKCLKNPKVARAIRRKLLEEYYPVAVSKVPKPNNMRQSQYLNYLAIHMLEDTGNEFPTQKAINFVESLLKRHYKKLNSII